MNKPITRSYAIRSYYDLDKSQEMRRMILDLYRDGCLYKRYEMKPEEQDLEHAIAELKRENQMLLNKNEHMEKEMKWLETMVNNLQIEVLNLKNKKETS